jgi:hypothetical protein
MASPWRAIESKGCKSGANVNIMTGQSQARYYTWTQLGVNNSAPWAGWLSGAARERAAHSGDGFVTN